MIKLKDLLEKSMLAGRHDEKETLEIVRDTPFIVIEPL